MGLKSVTSDNNNICGNVPIWYMILIHMMILYDALTMMMMAQLNWGWNKFPFISQNRFEVNLHCEQYSLLWLTDDEAKCGGVDFVHGHGGQSYDDGDDGGGGVGDIFTGVDQCLTGAKIWLDIFDVIFGIYIYKRKTPFLVINWNMGIADPPSAWKRFSQFLFSNFVPQKKIY